MIEIELLRELEGKHTVETLMEILNYKKQSVINLISKLKKEGYVGVTRGSNKKRIYTISVKKKISRPPGMFDIINKYSKIKVIPLYEHHVEGKYFVEDALVDAILTRERRVILAALRLFDHIDDWSRLYQLSKKNNMRNFVVGMYEVSKRFIKVKKIPKKTYDLMKKARDKFNIKAVKRTDDFKEIEKEFRITIPYSKQDLEGIK